MSDCCFEGSCGPSVCVEGPCLSTSCWSPAESTYSSVCSGSSCSDVSISTSSSSLDFGTASIYGKSLGASESPISSGMDSSKSVQAMLGDGSLKAANASPRQDQGELIKAGEAPKIIVSNDSAVSPDFIVKKDGKVEVVGDPESGDKPHSVYRIQVEPGADPKSTDQLVSYLNDRIKAKDSSAQATLYATPGLVSDELRKVFEPKAPPQDNANNQPNPEQAPEEPPAPDQNDSPCNPGGGGGGGGCPGGDCPGPSPSDDATPPADTPADNSLPSDSAPVSTPMDGLIDAARLNTWENGANNSLGAYEMNVGAWYSSFLTDEMLEELGNPPDYRKLGKILAKHKNNPKFKQNMESRLNNMKEQGDTVGADKINSAFDKLSNDPLYAENFGIFLNGQQSGRNATGEEMQNFFDKDMQKAVASSRISDVAHEAGVKIKDLPAQKQITMALAGALGHVPKPEEMAQYEKYLQVVGERFKPGNFQVALK